MNKAPSFLDRQHSKAKKKYIRGAREHGGYKFDFDTLKDIKEELRDCAMYCYMQLERMDKLERVLKKGTNVTRTG